MENIAPKAIAAIVGIILTVLLISFIFGIWNQQKTSGNKAMAQVEQISANMEEADITQYDGETVTGSQVLSAIKTLEGKEVSIAVIQTPGTAPTTVQSEGGNTYVYNYKADSDKIEAISTADRSKDYTDAKSKTTSAYITPSAKYNGSIVRSENTGAILQLIFQRTN